MITDRLRLPIRLVASNAEHTGAPVPDRLPTTEPSEARCEVLVMVMDDSARSQAFIWLNQALLRINQDLSNQFHGVTDTPDVKFVVGSTRARIEAAAA